MDKVEKVRKYFGARVRTLRQDRGWKIREMAEKVGKTETSLSRLELGKQNVSLVEIIQIADVLGVSLGALFPQAPVSGACAASVQLMETVNRQHQLRSLVVEVLQGGLLLVQAFPLDTLPRPPLYSGTFYAGTHYPMAFA